MSKKSLFVTSVMIAFGALTLVAAATHSWGGYHWARTANPFVVKIGSNITSAWTSALATAASDWSQSTVLDMNLASGLSNPKNCKPTLGRVEVCNSKYGNNNWLGIASVWASGSHITQGTVKLNDTYFNTPTYNTAAWRALVTCQEVGHTIGLDHQDEVFTNANLNTCMDYTNNPLTNQHPNQHDYDMLETIYAHLDTTTTLSQLTVNGKPEINHDDPGTWGRELRKSKDGRSSLYEKDSGNGEKVFTFVIWAR